MLQNTVGLVNRDIAKEEMDLGYISPGLVMSTNWVILGPAALDQWGGSLSQKRSKMYRLSMLADWLCVDKALYATFPIFLSSSKADW